MNHTPTVETLKAALQIKEQIQKLESRLTGLLNGKSTAVAAPSGKRRTLSAAVKAKLAASAKARWAKIKAKSGAAKTMAKPASKAKPKKGTITPEGRAKLAALMKARWATRKKAAAAPNAATKKS